jgi:catechol 2,3-dioxygenase-like lactoylglutathione lyase family enzyme
MLTDAPLVAFAATTNLDRAREFYGDMLGLRLTEQNQFAAVFATPAAMLRVTLVDKLVPAGYTVLGWEVPDIVAAVHDLAARGIDFNHYDGFDQDADGIWTAPSGARVAWFPDPDGNTLSLTEFTGA